MHDLFDVGDPALVGSAEPKGDMGSRMEPGNP